MKTASHWIAFIGIGLLCANVHARKDPNQKSNQQSNSNTNLNKAANCAPATSFMELDLNNVRARVEVAGRLYQNRAQSVAAYEVPKGSGQTAIYAASVWMGGIDASDQLRLAAATFGNGNEFWAGPLDTTGTAEVSAETCADYDRFFKITKDEVREFVAWFNCTGNDCDPDYEIPESIINYPAHGNTAIGQDFYLAPFFDANNDGIYNPVQDGDYPYYDLYDDFDCTKSRKVILKGDETIWWVFNDKGNIHTESEGEPIGMEVHAQAFAFATNDEINDMTFLNFEMINRGTQQLRNAYFSMWVDPDVGNPTDDYVGCDVQRGLGYCYGGDAFDEDFSGAIGYGANPPAIGVDFFEGPYQDNDGIANQIYDDYNQAIANNGIVYPGIGIGYQDTMVDNERLGMRKFIYYSNPSSGAPAHMTDPRQGTPSDYYNYMRGLWRNGDNLCYGGTGNAAGAPCTQANYMFPGDSDPLGWGTDGVPQQPWSEITENTQPADRRFLQSAGPFTLDPGAVNNITVGVVYARSAQGDPFASVEKLRRADDKAQALFDNCFRIVEAPDAPELVIQETDRELQFQLFAAGNNINENFASLDPTIDSSFTDRVFAFQGYQVFQLVDQYVSVSDLQNPDKAREVFQCDLKDSVDRLINFYYDEDLEASHPLEMVDGENEGLKHSFNITEDLFATGDRRLINHKTYYYMAVAYSHNSFKKYSQNDPTLYDGQKLPYKASRRSGSGGAVKVFTGIPHIPTPELEGTVAQAEYGDGPIITRIEGQGNGGRILDLTEATENLILNSSEHKADHPSYKRNKGPIDVKVIDPLNVPPHSFTLRFIPDGQGSDDLDAATWELINQTTNEVITSDQSINVYNEQLFPDYGFSIAIEQYISSISTAFERAELLESEIIFDDPYKNWLTGVPDLEGEIPQNWILSGVVESDPSSPFDDLRFSTTEFIDGEQYYENILGGTWAPYRLVSIHNENYGPGWDNIAVNSLQLGDLPSVDIVITKDPTKWTRCPVVEMQFDPALAENGAEQMLLRQSPSVNKNGDPDGSGTVGMGWFPGYAINLETGERLNMAFGENSWLAVDNGRDMQWNPTQTMYSNTGDIIWGGMHYIWVFQNVRGNSGDQNKMPHYDEGVFAYDKLSSASPGAHRDFWKAARWTSIPLVAENRSFMETDVRVKLRTAQPYKTYQTDNSNNSYPEYFWDMTSLSTTTQEIPVAEDALSLINVVPNPYYAYSAYETSRLDNRVKITNLPDKCTVSIYNVKGTLVRRMSKDNRITSLDWDLKNSAGIPIAGGVYIIHIDAPGIGEYVVKWFGAMRPTDVSNF